MVHAQRVGAFGCTSLVAKSSLSGFEWGDKNNAPNMSDASAMTWNDLEMFFLNGLVRFASIACGHANFAVTNRGVVHSWAGSQAQGLRELMVSAAWFNGFRALPG